MNIPIQAGRGTPIGQLGLYSDATARVPKPVSHARALIHMSAVRRIKPFAHGIPLHVVPVSEKAGLTHRTSLQHVHKGRAVAVSNRNGLATGH